MRKKTKIILIVISSIIVLVGVLLFLILKTNLFLDTSDLVCSRVYVDTETEKQIDKVILSFDKDAIIKNIVKESVFVYNDYELAKQNYDDFLLNLAEDSYNNLELKEEVNTVVLEREEGILEKENKEKIKIKYEGFGYECN